MKSATAALAVLALVSGAALVHAQPAAAPAAPARTMPPATPLALPELPAKATLKVSSPAFKPGGTIPIANTGYGPSTFPGLAWSKGPYGTKVFVVIMQDADVNFRGGPLLHWSMYDIPGGVTKLAPGLTAPPAGASFGPNVRGPNHAYMGPHTPPGPKHHYHFQVFALDQEVPADPALSYDALAAAMGSHVLASGEVVGLGQADPNAPPRAPAPAAPTAKP